MQNTQINPTTPAVGNVDANMTEGSMGRMGNFNAGVNGAKTNINPPKVTKTDITGDIK